MSNLATEYFKRHKIKCVAPTNDGFCFFNNYNIPALVCLTSTTPKCYKGCPTCNKSNTPITIELFTVDSQGKHQLYDHYHAHPDENLLSSLKERTRLLGTLTPVYFKNNQQIELWLWQFFITNNKIKQTSSWPFATKSNPSQTNLYEEMLWCAMKNYRFFNCYYTMYQELTAGRKYLLFE